MVDGWLATDTAGWIRLTSSFHWTTVSSKAYVKKAFDMFLSTDILIIFHRQHNSKANIGAGRNNKVGRKECAPSKRGQWSGILGGGFELPAKGLGKYCKLHDELRDRGLGRNPAANGFCALRMLF